MIRCFRMIILISETMEKNRNANENNHITSEEDGGKYG